MERQPFGTDGAGGSFDYEGYIRSAGDIEAESIGANAKACIGGLNGGIP